LQGDPGLFDFKNTDTLICLHVPVPVPVLILIKS